ncbi:hypothetical protein LO762_12605 [Actinocorallia sp. API 0066]|uniref:hypothetical protein n=1 Tax=Actinocorallia sp. API 0066 TaxID=2896846 RepID=UPI001E397786|nr:hypothetical protein [Actinocorallia sp. API 0066]MCD0450027.1 hypothetical protein [Actinocorallia sp. API 0066]
MVGYGLDKDDFQLYLLKTMDPPTPLLDSSLGVLGSDRGGMKVSYGSVSELMKPISGSPHSLKAMLRDSLVSEDGSGGNIVSGYRLSLWPEFVFWLAIDSSGLFIEKAGFGRASGGPRTGGPIEPWGFVIGDLDNEFSGVEFIDEWGHYSTCHAWHGESGKRLFLRFAWGLLQEVDDR